MKIAFFHELTKFSGARKAVNEYGKFLNNSNKVDLYYVDEIQDVESTKFFNKVFFFKFQGREWHGKDWKGKFYKDTVELFKLYFLHRRIGKLIASRGYDFVIINPSKYTQAPFILRCFSQEKVYYCPEPLRMVYENIFDFPQEMFFHKRIYEICTRKIKQIIDRINLKNANLILVNSVFTKTNVYKSYKKNSIICYPGVDEYKYISMNLTKATDILFLGITDVIEGYDLLEEALKYFKIKPILKIIYARDKGKGLSEKDLIIEYNKSKIVVCLAINEPFGLVPLEAMSCEVPVIAVNEGGYKETVINNKTGFLIKRDPKELSEKIKLLLSNPSLAREMGENGRKEVLAKWTWEKRGKELERILLKAYGNIDNNR